MKQMDSLIANIELTHSVLQKNATKAVNISLTLRNLLIGFYIVEFEQNGKDRAKYGTKLLTTIANKIKIKGLTAPELSRCRQFYKVYNPVLGDVINNTTNPLELDTEALKKLPMQILGTVTQEFNAHPNPILGIPSQELKNKEITQHYRGLFTATSYSNFTELIKINDAQKRKFYELLILKTHPSNAELKRQINSLAYERLGLSKNKDLAFEQLQQKVEPTTSSDLVKSHYFFEFLDVKHPGLIAETELESALINHLQDFILELGNGFCFEARQKRVLIGDEYFFLDLVFYHRILKCHVIVELKTEKAKHQHIGQLRAYLQHYKKHIMQAGDNPPVGILLVTDKNETLVEYAIADTDKELFVSKYLLQLPKKEDLESFINNELGI